MSTCFSEQMWAKIGCAPFSQTCLSVTSSVEVLEVFVQFLEKKLLFKLTSVVLSDVGLGGVALFLILVKGGQKSLTFK